MRVRLTQKYYLSMIFLAITASCNQPAANSQFPLPKFDKEGHRGARGLMPENTIPAMYKAIDLGVTSLEMDVHITRDNLVILSHDDHIDPTFTLSDHGSEMPMDKSQKLAFFQMDYATISKFDVGSKFYPKFPDQQKMKVQIPLLSSLIDSVQNYLRVSGKPQVFYNIETKSKPQGDRRFHPEPVTFVKLLMDVIEEKKISPWVIIQSFDSRTLQVMNTNYPKIKTSLLVEKGSLESNLLTLGFLPTVYSPHFKLVTAELVKQCHAKGLKIIPWTVNSKKEIENFKMLNVDGIITDYPNLFN